MFKVFRVQGVQGAWGALLGLQFGGGWLQGAETPSGRNADWVEVCACIFPSTLEYY